MGYGTYSTESRDTRAKSAGYYTKSADEIFTQQSINNAMNPYGIVTRESRDSAEHPESLSIIIALDVTGSMGSIPHYLVKEGLPNLVTAVIASGIPDPQILFLGIGDHECDQAPLQVGQFESSDELLDKWLTDVYLEGGGGANYGESYLLAWYFAAFHTTIDCFEKRKKKGFLFTIGDEPVLEEVPAAALKKMMGKGQYENFTAERLFKKASEKYNVFHIHVKETSAGARKETIDGWKQLVGQNLLTVKRKEDISKIIPETIIKLEKPKGKAPAKNETAEEEEML